MSSKQTSGVSDTGNRNEGVECQVWALQMAGKRREDRARNVVIRVELRQERV